MNKSSVSNRSLPRSALLILVGQLLYIVVTVLHTGGEANDHHAIFAAYAASTSWTIVHLGQFVAMAILCVGLVALSTAFQEAGSDRPLALAGATGAMVSLCLYGALQAVDGVALKQSVMAWETAPDTESLARFTAAETVRWLEWGLRSYHDLALGLTYLAIAATAATVSALPRPIPFLMALTGLSYVAQGYLAGTEGFSPSHSIVIVAAWIFSFVWMVWIVAGQLMPRRSQNYRRGAAQKSVSR